VSPPQLAPILPQPATVVADAEASSTSSSADTTTTTPQSPVSSVVCFRAAPPAAKPAAAVQGRCAVLLQRGGSGLGVEPDPEGASLAASLQEAVRAGSLSVKQAAASLASYLRQRQQQAAAAAGSASSSPGHGCRHPSSVSSSGMLGGTALSPFALSGPEVRQEQGGGNTGDFHRLATVCMWMLQPPCKLFVPFLPPCAATVLPQPADRPQPEPLGEHLHQQPTGGQGARCWLWQSAAMAILVHVWTTAFGEMSTHST
jgi:hypothetical protein